MNFDVEYPLTLVNPNQRSQSRQLPSSPAEQSEQPRSSSQPSGEASVIPQKTPQKRSSTPSRGPSGTESSDDSDKTYTGLCPTPPWRSAHWNGKKATRRRRIESTTRGRGPTIVGAGAAGRSRDPQITGSAHTDQASVSSEDKIEESDDVDSEEDEYAGPYRGPHLHVISVEWINDRLDRSFYKYTMTIEHLGQWAAWWPRTKVAQHHRLDSAGVWLLTVGVHKWWSDLYDELNS